MIIKFVIIFLFISFNVYSADCEKPKMPTDDQWNNWLSNIKKEALEIGITQNTIQFLLINLLIFLKNFFMQKFYLL